MLHPFNCLRAKSKSFLNSPTESVSPGGWPMMLWMNEHFANLIHKKMGSWNPHSHHGKEGSLPPWSVNRDCLESPDTTSTQQEQSRGLNREPEMEIIAKSWEPCSHQQDKRRSEGAPKQIKTQTRGKDGKLCSAEANRRFLRMTSQPGTLKILMYGKTNTIL